MSDIVTALNACAYPFKHFAWAHAPTTTYGVYAEDSAQHLYDNNGLADQTIQGTIDLYTRDDSDTPRETVQAALATTDASWYLNSIQYEEDTHLIHIEWVFEVFA